MSRFKRAESKGWERGQLDEDGHFFWGLFPVLQGESRFDPNKPFYRSEKDYLKSVPSGLTFEELDQLEVWEYYVEKEEDLPAQGVKGFKIHFCFVAE